jgi:hypothetical protein
MDLNPIKFSGHNAIPKDKLYLRMKELNNLTPEKIRTTKRK